MRIMSKKHEGRMNMVNERTADHLTAISFGGIDSATDEEVILDSRRGHRLRRV